MYSTSKAEPLQPTYQLLALRICSPGRRASHAMKESRPGIKGSNVTLSPCSQLAQHLWLSKYWDCGGRQAYELDKESAVGPVISTVQSQGL
ncbi:hypothetical protein D623_10026368 [Myotis brandtii]|uniref:Uncharacterized protein n=1 Tax=Myotis brandtii TaxID=109478 RepID=S7PC06_MYOBR|nr:hypothetical protein D623_10026368 [Myotis brandtii]